MKIAIDCRWVTSDIGGIRNYTLNLVKNLIMVDAANEYLLIYDIESTKHMVLDYINNKKIYTNFTFIKIDYSPFSIKSQLLLPFILNKNKVDVFHSTSYMIPLFGCKCKLMITLHDLIPYLHPQLCCKSKIIKVFWLYKRLIKLIINSVDKIITVSDNSKKDIIHSFSKSIPKVQAVYNGYNDNLTKISDENLINQFKKKIGFPDNGKFILYIGRQDPSKNLAGLIKSFFELSKKLNNIYLVIVGKRDNRYSEPYDLIKQYDLTHKVIFLNVLSFEEINLIYNSCDIFVFPSYYEGFGLPPLEAMVCGLPVICSNTSSLPEVVGDAALLINPDDITEISEKMYVLLTDEKLKQQLIEKGFQQIKRFSWKITAIEMVKVYDEMLVPTN